MRSFYFILLFGLISFISCRTKMPIEILPEPRIENEISYQGRIDHIGDSIKLFSWPGTSAKIQFEGSYLSFDLKDDKGDNYYYAILDNKLVEIIKPTTVRTKYEILSETEDKDHYFELLKISEWPRGKSSFFGFDIKDGKYSEISRSDNDIVFYGNSITCAYAVDDDQGDSPDSTYTNFSKSYAKLTADRFSANYSSISRSGIGIMISWFDMIMPEMYDRIDPEDDNRKWDFSEDNTDIVVINLLQNDSWLVNRPELQVFKDKFGTTAPSKSEILDAYKSFISQIREAHPKANIVCMLGNMDISHTSSIWPGYVEEAVTSINDPKVFTLVVPYKNTSGHPDTDEQIILSNTLIDFINTNNLWE